MGFGTWLGWGDAFQTLGNEFGQKRLEGKYRREEAERLQTDEGRKAAEFAHTQTLWPYDVKKAQATLDKDAAQTAGYVTQNKLDEGTLGNQPQTFSDAHALAVAQRQADEERRRTSQLTNEAFPKREAAELQQLADASSASRASVGASMAQQTEAGLRAELARNQLLTENQALEGTKELRSQYYSMMQKYTTLQGDLISALKMKQQGNAVAIQSIMTETAAHLDEMAGNINEAYKQDFEMLRKPGQTSRLDLSKWFPMLGKPADPAAGAGGGGTTGSDLTRQDTSTVSSDFTRRANRP